jgi:hypothetical protein
MSENDFNLLKSRGNQNVPIAANIQIAACLTVSQAASALGKMARGHKKTGLTEAELARRRSQGAKLAGFKAAKRAAPA